MGYIYVFLGIPRNFDQIFSSKISNFLINNNNVIKFTVFLQSVRKLAHFV